ncbi:MAG: PqqD family protein [Burkholderiales bacterium]
MNSHSGEPNVTTDLLASLPVPRSTIVWVKLPDGAVLFKPEDEAYYSLNAVGTLIWERLPEAADMDALCSSVHQHFPDAEAGQMRADVVALLDELTRAGLVDCPGWQSAA